MTIETAQLLTLAQWLSPAYPTGGFAWSHGLETAVAEGAVRDAAGFGAWLGDVLEHGAARSEALFLAEAHRAGGDEALARIDARARAFAPCAERLAETVEQGAAFARITAAIWGMDLPTLAQPVAVGRAAALAALPLEPVMALYLQGFAANLAAAAQRLVPLGQTDAQTALAARAPLIARIAAEAAAAGPDALSSTAFLADIAAMRHEPLQPRIFRS